MLTDTFTKVFVTVVALRANFSAVLPSLAEFRRRSDFCAEPLGPHEMAGDGLTAPAVAVIRGDLKYIHCDTDPALMSDRAVDPHETENLTGNSAYADAQPELRRIVEETWDFAAIRDEVLECQRRRRIVENAHSGGKTPSWDYDQLIPGASQYFRAVPENPSASNYASNFEVRLRPDSESGMSGPKFRRAERREQVFSLPCAPLWCPSGC